METQTSTQQNNLTDCIAHSSNLIDCENYLLTLQLTAETSEDEFHEFVHDSYEYVEQLTTIFNKTHPGLKKKFNVFADYFDDAEDTTGQALELESFITHLKKNLPPHSTRQIEVLDHIISLFSVIILPESDDEIDEEEAFVESMESEKEVLTDIQEENEPLIETPLPKQMQEEAEFIQPNLASRPPPSEEPITPPRPTKTPLTRQEVTTHPLDGSYPTCASAPAQEFIQVVDELYYDEELIMNETKEVLQNSNLYAQQQRLRDNVQRFILQAPIQEAEQAFSLWKYLNKIGNYILPEKINKPDFLELLNQDPTLATLAGLVWKQITIQNSSIKPLAIFQIVMAIVSVLLTAIILGMSYSSGDSALKIGLTVTSLVSNLGLLLGQMCLIWKVSTVFNVKDITNVVYGLTERAAIDEGLRPSDTRYHEILSHISRSFNISGVNIQERINDITCVPPGSKFSPYSRLLRNHLKTLSQKYPAMTASPYLAVPCTLADNSDFLYKVFYDFRAFRTYAPEELAKLPENLREDPRPFIKQLITSIRAETGVDLSSEPFPISTTEYFHPATFNTVPIPQADNTLTSSILKGLACTMGLFAMLAGKSITDFKSFFTRVKSIKSTYTDTVNVLYSTADFFSSWIYEIFGFDVLNIEAKKFQISIFKDTAAHIMTMSKESLGSILGAKESFQKLLLEANEIQYDSWVLLEQSEKNDFKRIINDFTKFIADIPEVTKNSFRQIPTAIYFHGHPGSGKTELSLTLLTDRLRRDFGLNGAFTLKQDGNGHNTEIPAGRGDIAIIDEIGTKTEDSLVENLPLIISATPWNCPSAFKKNQLFEPKVVILINNQNSIQSANVRPESANAITSRLLSYEVIHDDYAANPNIERDSMKRDPHYHNVKFYRCRTFLNGVVAKEQKPMSFGQVYAEIAQRLKHETEQHERRLNEAQEMTLKHCPTPGYMFLHEIDLRAVFESLQEADANEVFYRTFYNDVMNKKLIKIFSIHQLSLLGKALRSTICVHAGNKTTIVHKGNGKICCKVLPYGPLHSHKIYANKTVCPINQKSAQDFLTVHLSSPPGLGKTTYIESKGRELAKMLKWPYYKITAASVEELSALQKETNRCVVLFDDFVNSKPDEYQALYDYIPQGSIIHITSNLQFIPDVHATLKKRMTEKVIQWWTKGSRQVLSVKDNRTERFPKGWYRRLNFPYPIFDNEYCEVIPTSDSSYFHSFQNPLETDNWYSEKVLPGLIEFFKQDTPKEIRFSPNPPHEDCPIVTFKTRKTFFETFKTPESVKSAFFNAFLGRHPNIKFHNVPGTLVNGTFDPAKFYADEKEHPLTIIERFGNMLRPLVKMDMLWKFEEGNNYCLTSPHMIFHNFEDEQAGISEKLTVFRDGILITFGSKHSRMFVWAELDKILSSDKVDDIEHFVVLKNRDFISPYVAQNGFKEETLTITSIADTLATNYKAIISSIVGHPLFIIGSIVVACIIAATAFIGCIKLFTNTSLGKKENEDPEWVSALRKQAKKRLVNHGKNYDYWADEVEDMYPSDPVYLDNVYESQDPVQVDETNSDDWVFRKIKTPKKPMKAGFNSLKNQMGIKVKSDDPGAVQEAIKEIEKIQSDPKENRKAQQYALKYDSEIFPVQNLPGQQTIVYEDALPKKKRLGRRATYQYAPPTHSSGKVINAVLIDKATCIVEFNGAWMHGFFLGKNVVATCSHLMTPDDYYKGEEVVIKEQVDDKLKVWKGIPFFYGFSKVGFYEGSKTELMLIHITNKEFPAKPDLTKLCYSEQEMEDFSRLKYTSPGAILYKVDSTQFVANLEVNVNRTLLRTDPVVGEGQGQCISSPIFSHVLTSHHSIDKILKPGACGSPIFNPAAPLGTPCIYGLHSLFRVEATSISFPMYRNTLREIIKSSSPRLLTPQGSTLPELYTSFGERKFKINFPQGWNEVIAEATETPRYLSEAALNENKDGIRDSSKLKFICKIPMKDFSAPPRHRYKRTRVSPHIPYPPPKFPAPLFPSDLSDEAVEFAGKQFHVSFDDEGKMTTPEESGPNIISKQLMLMDRGTTNEQFTLTHSQNFRDAGTLFREAFEKLVRQQRFEPNLKKEGPTKWRFLTDDEVFNGITDQSNPLHEGISGIQEDSSAGPTCFAMGFQQKSQLFETVGKNLDGSEKRDLKAPFKEVYRDLVKRMQDGEVIIFPDQAKLKSELLKPEKCEQANTRAYICRDAMMMFVEKKVFGILQGIFHRSKGDHFSAIGMDPILHFPKIFSRFQDKHLSKVLAADATRWDKNTLRAVLEQVFLNIKMCAPWRNANKSSNLYDALVCSIIDTVFVSRDELFLVKGGMPSGTYVTTLVNICIHLWLLCLMVVTATKELKLKFTPNKILDQLFYIFMGDDFLLGVNDYWTKHVKATWIQEFYLSCNVILTNPQKTKNQIEYVPFEKMEFCSRTFKRFVVNGELIITFPLKKMSVMADSHYTTHDNVETAISICRVKLIEAALHGPEFYESEASVVRTILRIYGVSGTVVIPDWEEQIHLITHKDAVKFIPQSGRKPLTVMLGESTELSPSEKMAALKTLETIAFLFQNIPHQLNQVLEGYENGISKLTKDVPDAAKHISKDLLSFRDTLKKTTRTITNAIESFSTRPNMKMFFPPLFDLPSFVHPARTEVRFMFDSHLSCYFQLIPQMLAKFHDSYQECLKEWLSERTDPLVGAELESFAATLRKSVKTLNNTINSLASKPRFSDLFPSKYGVSVEQPDCPCMNCTKPLRIVAQSQVANGPKSMAPEPSPSSSPSAPGGATASTSSYLPAELKANPSGTMIVAQPTNEDYSALANYGDPRTIFDCLDQDFVIRQLDVDADQASGTVLARFPWGFDSAPDFMKTIFMMHTYIKGYILYKCVIRGAGASGSLRISHVKDINKTTYTLLDLEETNASYVLDLSQINASETLEMMLDYTHLSQKAFSIEKLMNGTFVFEPSRPGIVITVNTRVQNIFNNVCPSIEVSANFKGFVLTTPSFSGSTPTPSGNTNLLTAMQGMTLAQMMQSFGDPLTKTSSIYTDGCFGPDPNLVSSQSASFTGINLDLPAEVAVSTDLNAGAETDQPISPDVVSMCISSDKTTTRGRVYLMQGNLPFNTQAQPNQNLEQAMSTQCITVKTPTFPFPNLDSSDIEATIAILADDLKTKAGTAAIITRESTAVVPATVQSLVFNFIDEDSGAYLPKEQVVVDLTANPVNLSVQTLTFASAQFNGRLWIIDADFPPALTKQFFPKSGLTNTVFPKEVILKFLLSPLKTPAVTPNIISASGMTQLPTTLRAVLIGDTDSTVVTKVGSNDGLPTCASLPSTELLRFATRQLQSGQKAEFVLYSSAMGKVACVMYASKNFGRLYINSSTGKYYTKFQNESASSLIIQSVSIKNESENPVQTDDSNWLSRAQTQKVTPIYRSQRLIASSQAMMAVGMGASALGGLFSGLGQAASKNNELKQQAQQALLDRQLKRDLATQNADVQIQLADKTNSAMMQRTNATNYNQLALAGLNNANSWRLARMNNATQTNIASGNNATSKQIAKMNNDTQQNVALIGQENVLSTNETSKENSERALEGTKFSASTGLAGSLANAGTNLVGTVLNTFVNQPAQRENAIKQIDETGDQQRKNMLYAQEIQAGSNLAANT